MARGPFPSEPSVAASWCRRFLAQVKVDPLGDLVGDLDLRQRFCGTLQTRWTSEIGKGRPHLFHWWVLSKKDMGEGHRGLLFGIFEFSRNKNDRKEYLTMPYKHLTPTERGQIQALHQEGRSMRYIAHKLNRSVSTISRELRRNSTPKGYDARHADAWYHRRRQDCRPARKLDYPLLWKYMMDKMVQNWTPEQVAGYLPHEYPDEPRMRISYETIYQAIYSDKRLQFLIEYLPQARPKRRKRGQGKTRRGPSIPNRVGIEKRPTVVDQRARLGDWEGDTIVGANQQGYILTLVERRSKLLMAAPLKTKQADDVAQAVIRLMEDLPISWVKTITFDNGTEFASHQNIADVLPVDIYFAAPYSSYQRGTNENTNGLIRRYLPKGTNLKELTQEQLNAITHELNNRPRKTLWFRTPNEVFSLQRQNLLVALSA